MVVVFRVAEDDGDVVGCGALADAVHFGAVSAKGIFYVLGDHFEVDGTLPV